ncbi:unnamed protein product, partial [Iphiclides podalirius]
MSWHTKEDVLDDLAQVMGNEIKELDEQYILIGEQPPPPSCTSNEADDHEIYLRLYGALGDKLINDDTKGPDLSGITEMLRMVDDYHCSNNNKDEAHILQSCNKTGIVITKLNVDIPEYIPENASHKENTKVEVNTENKTKNGEPSNDMTQNSELKPLPTGPSPQVNEIKSALEIAEKANSANQEVEESVAKVNSWLNKGNDHLPSASKGPALYLGPVTFKRKQAKKPKSPISEASDKSLNRMVDTSFVPSEYASKLTQSYMDRVKAKEDKSLDIWGKLERDLKAKDEEVKSTRRQQQLA